MNVISSQQHWFNGLLVSDLDDGFFTDSDKRERGYNRIRVAPSYLQKYDSSYTTSIPRNIYIYAGGTNQQSDSILPNTSYLDTCLEGAKQWGEDFYNDFLDSTFIKNNALLRTYVE